MSIQKIDEARLLYVRAYYESSYYIAGYAIEFILKARICDHLGIELYQKPLSSNVSKAFLTHDLRDLVLLSGLHKELEEFKNASENNLAIWSVVVDWKEDRRYGSNCKQQTVKNFIDSVTDFHGWIKQHLN